MLYCNLLLVIICLIPCTVSNLDLYLPKDEVYKLFGKHYLVREKVTFYTFYGNNLGFKQRVCIVFYLL